MAKKNVETLPKIKLSRTVPQQDFSEENLAEYRKESKQKLDWTSEEVSALNTGVHEYGLKHWSLILEKFHDVFQGRRRVVDLVSKYRLLHRKSSYYKAQNRDWIMIDKKNSPMTDAMGEVITMTTRFPYEAAMNMAKKKWKSGENSFIIRIREGNDINQIHVYAGNREIDGKLTLKKMKV